MVADKGGSLWTATVFLSNPALPGITPVEHTAAGSRKWVRGQISPVERWKGGMPLAVIEWEQAWWRAAGRGWVQQ